MSLTCDIVDGKAPVTELSAPSPKSVQRTANSNRTPVIVVRLILVDVSDLNDDKVYRQKMIASKQRSNALHPTEGLAIERLTKVYCASL